MFQPVHRSLKNIFNESNVASCLRNRLVRRILNDYKVEYISVNVTDGMKLTLDTVNPNTPNNHWLLPNF